MTFGAPVIVTDDKGIEHHNAAVIHSTEAFPDWARVLVTDVEKKPAPKIGDHDVPMLVTTTKEYVVIAEKSDKPVAGKATWRPVPVQIPMGAPSGPPATPSTPPPGV